MKIPTGTGVGLVAAVAIAVAGCNGFGTNCNTDSDCTATNANAYCDPGLKVCFIRPGPMVTEIQPTNDATGVTAIGATVTATFSEAIVDAGVKMDSFPVTGQGFVTFGNYAANSDSTAVTFTPLAAGLAQGTEYTVNLTAAIKDGAGNTLQPFQSKFTTADGTWQSDTTYTASTNIGDFSVAASYFGEIVAAADVQIPPSTSDYWSLYAGVSAGVLAGGNTPNIDQPVYNVATDAVFSPQVSISSNGRAFVAFSVFSGTSSYFSKASTYDPTTSSWSSVIDLPVPPSPNTSDATVVALPSGNGIAAWLEQSTTGTNYNVKTRPYGATSGWSTTDFFIQNDTTADCFNLRLATDVLFYDVLAAWTQTGGTNSVIEVSYFNGTGNFQVPFGISDSTVASDEADIALGYYGKGGAVWRAQTGGNYHIWARNFDPTVGGLFGALKQIDNAPTSAFTPRIGAAANGNLVAVWIQSAGSSGGSVVAARYDASTGTWASPETLVTDTNNQPTGAVVTVDPGGNAIAVWQEQSGSVLAAYARRYTVSGGWSPPLASPATRLTTGNDTINSAFTPAAAVDALGLGSVFVSRTNSTNSNIYLDYIPYY
ncbi:MAG TPA: Ig-like domain-containing protein [Myxococcaceae bacterium]|nr:Ig-like domain-containing protein [Myxococcaceae bacterium]